MHGTQKNVNHSISVVYENTKTSTPDEIVKLKSNFSKFTEYEVTLNYDSNGFVNEVTIFNK